MPRQAELAPRRVRVVAGILEDVAGRVLIADRASSKTLCDYWEFPGGKIDGDESPRAALERELVEELGIVVESCRHLHFIEHDYTDLSVAIDFFLVSGWRGTPHGREGQQLRWIDKESLDTAGLLPADAPVVKVLQTAAN